MGGNLIPLQNLPGQSHQDDDQTVRRSVLRLLVLQMGWVPYVSVTYQTLDCVITGVTGPKRMKQGKGVRSSALGLEPMGALSARVHALIRPEPCPPTTALRADM